MRSCDATDIINSVTEELKRLTEWLPGMFPALFKIAGKIFKLHKRTVLKEM
jgi:hypothetical protein